MDIKHKRGVRLGIAVSLISLTIPAVALAAPPAHRAPAAPRSPGSFAPARATPRALRSRLARQGSLAVRLRHIADHRRRPGVRRLTPLSGPTGGAAGSWSGRPDWDAIAACESGGGWHLNTGNGYWGGLQFAPGTWFANGGGAFDGTGSFPYSSSAQIAVAERVFASQGPGAWPSCFAWA
ncbi:MAG TPA: transglycosylase family protein [Actinomycetota bacterium]